MKHVIYRIGMLFVILSLLMGTIHATEVSYGFFVVEDQRYDASENIDEIIPAGIFKQLMASLLLVEGTRNFDKDMYIVYDYKQPAFRAETVFELGDSIQISDAYQVLLMREAEDLYISTAIYLEKTEADLVNAMNRKAKALGMEHTSFMTGQQSTTSLRDIQILMSACLENTMINQALSMVEYKSSNGKTYKNKTMNDISSNRITYAITSNNSPYLMLTNKEDYHYIYVANNYTSTIEEFLATVDTYQKQTLLLPDDASFPIEGNIFQTSIHILDNQQTIALPYDITGIDMHYEMKPISKGRAPIEVGESLCEINVLHEDELIKTFVVNSKQKIYPMNRYGIFILILIGIGILEVRRKKVHDGKRKK